MKHVVEIRQTQRLAAEMRVAAAAVTLQDAKDICASSEAQLDDRQAGWAASMSAMSLDISRMASWAAAISHGEDDLRQARARAVRAADDKAGCDKDWAKARALADAADELLKVGLRATLRRREETISAENADRFARRSPQS